MSEELKPCPFCGGEAEIVDAEECGPQAYVVTCNGCMTSSRVIFALMDDATFDLVSAWNTRAAHKVKQGQIERDIWSAMIWAASNNPTLDCLPEYTDTGNSFAETECRAAARRILEALQ